MRHCKTCGKMMHRVYPSGQAGYLSCCPEPQAKEQTVSDDDLEEAIEAITDCFEFGLERLNAKECEEAGSGYATLLRLARLGAAVEAIKEKHGNERVRVSIGVMNLLYKP